MYERGSFTTLPATSSSSSSSLALGPSSFQGVLHLPHHLLHGPSPLARSAICAQAADDGFIFRTFAVVPHRSQGPPLRWPGAHKLYEGPVAKNTHAQALPPHHSIWLANEREQTAFNAGELPLYVDHLAAPAISPLGAKEIKYAITKIESYGEEVRKHEATYPNWYRTTASPESRRTTLPPQMTVSEAGLRLRLIRIASASSLSPQLGVVMQDLLHKEIRAAMYREEFALLSRFGSKDHCSEPSYLAAKHRRGTKRLFESTQSRAQSVEGMRKKLRTALVNPSRNSLFVSRNVEEILHVQPIRDPLYMSDFVDEDEILERAWMESMTRRNHQNDLGKSLLLQSVMNAMSQANINSWGNNTEIIASIHNRNRRIRASANDLEHETFSYRGHEELAKRFASSWRRHRGQLPMPPPSSP